jgi:tellurite resistance protein TerC
MDASMMEHMWVLVFFNLAVLVMLAIDLGVFHRDAHEVSVREAAGWVTTWVSLSLSFNFGIYYFMGSRAGLEFLTGYLIEQALSVDNIFVFVLIFSYFSVPKRYQHRVLFWGILGALLLRGTMIAVGAVLIQRFHWILYVFGAFLVFTGIRMAFAKDEGIDIESNPVIKLMRRILPVTNRYHGQKFFVREPIGPTHALKLVATPLFIVLVMVETTDLVFALDSIPAIFAVTTDPFIVYTSNVCAILGLRSMYFLLAGIVDKFRFLQLGLATVLTFVGVKMLIADFYKIPIGLALGVVAGVLVLSIVASLMFPEKAEGHPPAHAQPEIGDGEEVQTLTHCQQRAGRSLTVPALLAHHPSAAAVSRPYPRPRPACRRARGRCARSATPCRRRTADCAGCRRT